MYIAYRAIATCTAAQHLSSKPGGNREVFIVAVAALNCFEAKWRHIRLARGLLCIASANSLSSN